MNSVLGRIDGADGLIASVRRASDSVGNVGMGAGGICKLDQTLRDRETAVASAVLADELERIDMLLKGRAKARSSGRC